MASAFQSNAFQNNAFQIDIPILAVNEAIVREVRTTPAMIVTAAPTVLEVRTAPAVIEVFHG